MKAGRVKPIGITSLRRSALAPEVPPIADLVPGYSAAIWYGVFAPKGLPPEVAGVLRAAMAKAMQGPEVEETLSAQGFEPFNLSGEQVRALITTETAQWRQTVTNANLKF